MGERSEVYVAFDTVKLKHAVAVAEGGRGGEIRFVGEIENRPGTIERLIKKLARRYKSCRCASTRGRRAMVFIARCRRWGMTAWWWRRR